MTTQQKTWTNLGFHDLEQFYLARRLKKLHADQPPQEAPKEVQAAYDAPRGITYDKQNGSWRAFGPTIDKKQKYIGSYPEKKLAIDAREDYMKKHHPDLIQMTGIVYDRSTGKYKCYGPILNGKRKYLGTFVHRQGAIDKRAEYEKELAAI